MSFWDLLRPAPPAKSRKAPPPVTAAELREALAQAEADAVATEGAAAVAATDRATLLLAGDDAELDQADRRLQLAQRSADKSAAAVAALQERLREAEERERQEGLDLLFAEGQRALNRGLALYAAYHEAAAELARILDQMADAADAVEEANRKLSAAGDPRTLGDLDRVARPPASEQEQHRKAPWVLAEVPSGQDPDRLLWPPAAEGTPIHWGQPQPTANTSSGHHRPGVGGLSLPPSRR